MATGKQQTSTASKSPHLPGLLIALLGAAFFVLGLEIYAQALRGPFLFDDMGLPFYSRAFAEQPLVSWVSGVRPLLMLSFWFNFQASGYETLSYHALNVALHAANALLVFLLIVRLLRRVLPETRNAQALAALSGALFLLHPLQTEPVAYIAGRSELLSGLFVLAALVVFAGLRDQPISWRTTVTLTALYGCAVLSKEQAAVLPAVFVLLDLCLPDVPWRQAFKLHRRLYVVLAVAAGLGLIGIWAVISESKTAGFNVTGISWQDYLWTQGRVWFLYLGLFFLPLSQNADYDLPLSHSPLEHGAILGFAGVLALVVLAWRSRDRFPLASLGFLLFAILLFPTSSVIPIQDVAAERRIYLPMVGLILVICQIVISTQFRPLTFGVLTLALAISAGLSYERSRIWGDDVRLWSDTISKSPGKARAYTHLMFAYLRSNRCQEAADRAPSFPEPTRRTPEFLGAWGSVLDCARRPHDALDKYRQAAQLAPGAGTYAKLALAYMRNGQLQEGEILANQALRMPPRTPFDRSALDYLIHGREQSRSRSTLSR